MRAWKALVGLLIAVVLLAYLSLDRIVGKQLEQAASEALGVPARAGLVTVRPLAGILGVRRVRVANAPGFPSPDFLRIRRIQVESGLRALARSPVEIRRIDIRDVDVYLERGADGSNLAVLSQRFRDEDEAAEETAGEPSLVVHELVIRDIRARVRPTPGAELTVFAVEVPEVRMQDLGRGGGLSSSEITALVTRAVLDAVRRKTQGLPVALVRELGARTRKLPGVRLFYDDDPDIAPVGLGERVGSAVEDATGGVTDSLRGLMGRDPD